MRLNDARLGLGMFMLALVATSRVGFASGTVNDMGAATASRAVLAVVRPYFVPGYSMANCSKRSPRLLPTVVCPETARLRHWLQVRRLPMQESSLPFCRCQSGPRTVRIWQVSNNGRLARVNAWWDRGNVSFTDTFVVLRGPTGWEVDDEYCMGRPATSVYSRAGSVPCR